MWIAQIIFYFPQLNQSNAQKTKFVDSVATEIGNLLPTVYWPCVRVPSKFEYLIARYSLTLTNKKN